MVEVWEKQDVNRLTPGQLKNNLNLLLLKLPGTRRQDKEQLKFFRDSGGNIVQHFPLEEQFYRITLGQENVERVDEVASVSLESDDLARAWLVANLPFEYYSFKQLKEIVRRATDRLKSVADKLSLVKFTVRNFIADFVVRETDRQTEAAFKHLFDTKRLCFHLDCVECRFEIPPQVQLRTMRQLQHSNGDPVQRSLFDYAPDDLNEYEQSIALYLDRHPEVLWWYRNYVGPENFSVQGFRRNVIYPDFVVQEGKDKKPVAKVLVVESKGKHLAGNEDTKYKRKVADYFEKTGREVPWQQLAEEFEDHTFRFQVLDQGEYADQDWKHELKQILETE
jgi:hypothetical protein